jgi:hypothetical protein
MYDHILEKMIECVWNGNFFIPIHALVAIEQDLLTTEDVVNCVLEGEIVERQKDRTSGEYKYVIAGEALDNSPIEVVAKLHLVGDTYVITVYRVN